MQRTPKLFPNCVFPEIIGAYILIRSVSIVNCISGKNHPLVSSPQGGSGLARFCHCQFTENLHTQGRDYGIIGMFSNRTSQGAQRAAVLPSLWCPLMVRHSGINFHRVETERLSLAAHLWGDAWCIYCVLTHGVLNVAVASMMSSLGADLDRIQPPAFQNRTSQDPAQRGNRCDVTRTDADLPVQAGVSCASLRATAGRRPLERQRKRLLEYVWPSCAARQGAVITATLLPRCPQAF